MRYCGDVADVVIYNDIIMANRATSLSMHERQAQASELWLERVEIPEIARRLDVSQRTIYRDLDLLGLVPNRPVDISPVNPDNKPVKVDISLIPDTLISNASSLMDAWLVRASEKDSAAQVYLKVADHLAKLVGAYAPEKRLQGNFKIEPPEPVAIPADVVEATGEIIKELEIDDTD